jgi:hypothetical protein
MWLCATCKIADADAPECPRCGESREELSGDDLTLVADTVAGAFVEPANINRWIEDLVRVSTGLRGGIATDSDRTVFWIRLHGVITEVLLALARRI